MFIFIILVTLVDGKIVLVHSKAGLRYMYSAKEQGINTIQDMIDIRLFHFIYR